MTCCGRGPKPLVPVSTIPASNDNKPGDDVVTIPDAVFGGGEYRIVIEARNRDSAKGRKAIAEDLDKKMAERSANPAIYLNRTQDGLAREIGDWSEGESELGP